MKVIKFESENCTPCKMVDMMFKDLGFKVDEIIDVAKEDNMRLKYDVMKAPTIILLDDNDNELFRVIGFEPKKLEELISKTISHN